MVVTEGGEERSKNMSTNNSQEFNEKHPRNPTYPNERDSKNSKHRSITIQLLKR